MLSGLMGCMWDTKGEKCAVGACDVVMVVMVDICAQVGIGGYGDSVRGLEALLAQINSSGQQALFLSRKRMAGTWEGWGLLDSQICTIWDLSKIEGRGHG